MDPEMDTDASMSGDAYQNAEGDDGGASQNGCTYAGQFYTEGAVLCMDGAEYRCMNIHGRSFTWEPTGHPCAQTVSEADGDQDQSSGAWGGESDTEMA